MTDRVNHFVVTLADDLREDDAEDIVKALGMVRGVVSVEPRVIGWEERAERGRIRMEVWQDFHNAMKKILDS